jgi:hypothetical protein
MATCFSCLQVIFSMKSIHVVSSLCYQQCGVLTALWQLQNSLAWQLGAAAAAAVVIMSAVVLGLFTLPKVYEMRKDQIDSAVGTGRDVLQQQYNTAQAKVGDMTKLRVD